MILSWLSFLIWGTASQQSTEFPDLISLRNWFHKRICTFVIVRSIKAQANRSLDKITEDDFDLPAPFGDGENDDAATADLRKELFEAEDVIIGKPKDNDHGLSEILQRQKERTEKEDSKEEKEESNKPNVDWNY